MLKKSSEIASWGLAVLSALSSLITVFGCSNSWYRWIPAGLLGLSGLAGFVAFYLSRWGTPQETRDRRLGPDGFTRMEDWLRVQTANNPCTRGHATDHIGEEVILDWANHQHCRFSRCTVKWQGFPFSLVGCTFENTEWVLASGTFYEFQRWLKLNCLIENDARFS